MEALGGMAEASGGMVEALGGMAEAAGGMVEAPGDVAATRGARGKEPGRYIWNGRALACARETAADGRGMNVLTRTGGGKKKTAAAIQPQREI